MLPTVIRRPHIPLTLLVCALAVLLAAPATGQAKAPKGFFGAIDFVPRNNLSQANLDARYGQMKQAGVESLRTLFVWSSLEPSQGNYAFGGSDRQVGLAASAGLSVLPTVQFTPRWASPRPDRGDFGAYAPRKYSYYTSFLTALVRRYGPKGTYWTENPSVPKRPIREWQMWNEPSASYFIKGNYRKIYPKLLKAGYKGVKKVDKRAKVVLAGLASFQQSTGRKTFSWGDHKAFYQRGIRKYYDVAAVHPFNKTPKATVAAIAEHRKVMNRYRDRRKPIYVTEFTFLGSRGKIPRNQYLGLEVTAKQQRRNLTATYKAFARKRSLRVNKAFWYAWASAYSPTSCDGGGTDPTFQYAGLVSANGCNATVFTATPLLSAYRAAARKF